jgi:hypothetical protein
LPCAYALTYDIFINKEERRYIIFAKEINVEKPFTLPMILKINKLDCLPLSCLLPAMLIHTNRHEPTRVGLALAVSTYLILSSNPKN